MKNKTLIAALTLGLFTSCFATPSCNGITVTEAGNINPELACNTRIYVTNSQGKPLGGILPSSQPTRCIAQSYPQAVQQYLCQRQCQPNVVYHLVSNSINCKDTDSKPVVSFSSNLKPSAFTSAGNTFTVAQIIIFNKGATAFKKLSPRRGNISYKVS